MHIILGSQSPRRGEILSFFAIPFTQVASHFDEDNHPYTGDPQAHAMELALKKAEVLAAQFPNKVILTADTLVFREGRIYNKPKDKAEAIQFLEELCGHWHSVFTGMALFKEGRFHQAVEETRILFNPLTPEQIETYCEFSFFGDKAGGYAIQRAGGIIVSRIEGCYYNVMGLPINTLRTLLAEAEIDLWKYLKPF